MAIFLRIMLEPTRREIHPALEHARAKGPFRIARVQIDSAVHVSKIVHISQRQQVLTLCVCAYGYG